MDRQWGKKNIGAAGRPAGQTNPTYADRCAEVGRLLHAGAHTSAHGHLQHILLLATTPNLGTLSKGQCPDIAHNIDIVSSSSPSCERGRFMFHNPL